MREWIYRTTPTSNVLPDIDQVKQQLLSAREIVILPKDDNFGIMGNQHQEIYQPAVDMIVSAISQNKTICIAYDYDCDGITAGVALVTVLKQLHADVVSCVPSRLTDGYGLNYRLVTETVSKPCLVVTVDNGITSVEATKQLKAAGYEVLITDHHLQEGDLPEADYILNPKIYLTESDDEYMASGCYVAAKLGLRVLQHYNAKSCYTKQDSFYQTWQILTCLTGISIISDMIVLNPTMRYQLNAALSELSLIDHDGLRALMSVSGLRANRPITAVHLGFNLAPKINSAGRLGDAAVAFELLSTVKASSPSAAYLIANNLKSFNTNRKILEQVIFDEAVTMANELTSQYPHALVVYHANWHMGVLGIVAARLCEQYGIPVIVLGALPDGTLSGSGRAPDGIDLLSCVSACKKVLLKCGGHRVACGVTLCKENLNEFRQLLNTACSEQNTTTLNYQIDAVASVAVLQNINFQLFLTKFEPYGNGNPGLILELQNVTVNLIDRRGDQISLIVTQITDDGVENNMIISKFRPPEEWYTQLLHQRINALVTPNVNYVSGFTYYEYRIVDLNIIPETQED